MRPRGARKANPREESVVMENGRRELNSGVGVELMRAESWGLSLRATEGRTQSASLGYHYVALDTTTLLYKRLNPTRNRSSSTRIFF